MATQYQYKTIIVCPMYINFVYIVENMSTFENVSTSVYWDWERIVIVMSHC